MLFLDSELHPLSPVADLEAWRDRLIEMKHRYPELQDQETIDRELIVGVEYLGRRRELDARIREKGLTPTKESEKP